ncbi:MAG: tRNA-uridine aminocarboxypropyltransferase [Colwellia sp.]
MPRTLCRHCQRPETVCICRFTFPVANDIHLVVLQHPSEVSQSKGTVPLLSKSLRSCDVLVGENFTHEPNFLDITKKYQTLLLYPSEHAIEIDQALISQLTASTLIKSQGSKPLCLVILDGTWKKAYRMFMLSKNLQQLPQVCLPQYLANAGQYHIRKVAKKNALSSLEASCYALALIEAGSDFARVTPEQAGKYQPLLNKFQEFNQFQLSFRPEYSNISRKPDDS